MAASYKDLIAEACAQAGTFPVEIQRAALLRISRVQTAFDPAAARHTLEQGLALSKSDDYFFEEPHFAYLRVLCIAAVCPWRFVEHPSKGGGILYEAAGDACQVLLNHGHAGYLKQYLLHDAPVKEIPINAAVRFMANLTEDEQQALLRRIIDCWRENWKIFPKRFQGDRWMSDIVSVYGRILPADELLAVVEEIIQSARWHADCANRLLARELLPAVLPSFHLLRELDPKRAAALVNSIPGFTEAVQKYPERKPAISGWTAARTESEPAKSAANFRRFLYGRHTNFWKALAAVEQTDDFDTAMQLAQATYQKEKSKWDLAKRAYWVSCTMYRSIFYLMGRQQASWNLKRLPDPALQLFAQVELAAGLAGLPELL